MRRLMYVIVEGGLGAHANGVSNIIGKHKPAKTRENYLGERFLFRKQICKLPRTSRTFLPSANLEWHAAPNSVFVNEQATPS